MRIRFDRFTLIVLAVVGVLLVAAVITVNRSGRGAPESYRTDNTPETPVFNAFLALQNGDIATARDQYSAKVLKEVDGNTGYGPLRGESYYPMDAARRLRLLNTRPDPQDENRAYVTAAVDTYASGGLFNSGDTWTSERVVEIVREDNVWKINTMEFFE